jgi:hypothetical protein
MFQWRAGPAPMPLVGTCWVERTLETGADRQSCRRKGESTTWREGGSEQWSRLDVDGDSQHALKLARICVRAGLGSANPSLH